MCIYNEPSRAIEITMKGIYDNLPQLREFGIPQDKIAVVLVQDGILNCDSSVIERYSKFDSDHKSPLKERIEIIKSEMAAAKKKGKDAGVTKN